MLFWASFILTRPLGATVGDFLDKPVSDGGPNLKPTNYHWLLTAVATACRDTPPAKLKPRCIRKPERRPSFDGSGVSEIQPHAGELFLGLCRRLLANKTQEREAGKSDFLFILISHWNECKSLILHDFLTQPIRPWWSFVVRRCATVGAENDWCEVEHGAHARDDCFGWLDRICVGATAGIGGPAHD